MLEDKKLTSFSVGCIALSYDNKYFYTGGSETIIKKYSLDDLEEVDSFGGHSDCIKSLIVTKDDEWLLSYSSDFSVRIWKTDIPGPRDAVILQSDFKINCMDLSFDDKFLCIGSNKVCIYSLAYSLDSPGELVFEIDTEITSAKFSKKFLVTGDMNGTLRLYKIGSWVLSKQYNQGVKITSINISALENIIVSGGQDGIVFIWDTKSKHDELKFFGHTNPITGCFLIKDQKTIVTSSHDQVINVWPVPNFDSDLNFDINTLKVQKIWFNHVENRLEGLCIRDNSTFVYTWNDKGEAQELFDLCKPVLPSIFRHIGSELVLFYKYEFDPIKEFTMRSFSFEENEDYFNITTYNTTDLRKEKSSIIQANIFSAYITNDKQYLFTGECFRITIWEYSSLLKVKVIRAHAGVVHDCIANSNSNVLITYGKDKHLKKFNLGNLRQEDEEIVEEYSHKFYQEGDYCKIVFSKDNEFIYVALEASFMILELKTMRTIKVIDKYYLDVIISIKECLLLFHPNGIDFYSSIDFNLLSNYLKDYKFTHASMSGNHETIYILTEDNLKKIPNPLLSKNTKLVGDYKLEYDFLTHFKSVVKRTCTQPYTNSLWLIEPLHINLLHIYAYYNSDELLAMAVKQRLPFIRTQENWTPVSLCIAMKFNESLNAIIMKLLKLSNTDGCIAEKFTLKLLETSLIDLNLCGYINLPALYTSLLIVDTDPKLPKRCDSSIAMPAVCLSDSLFPDIKQFNISEEAPEDANAVIFEKTLVKFNMTLGSSESLEFMKSLHECAIEKIYKTKLISTIQSEKWKQVYPYMLSQSLFYAVYLASLTIYAVILYDHSEFLVLSFVLNLTLFAYESIFMYLNFWEYFSEPLNLMDSGTALLVLTFIIMTWGGYGGEGDEILLGVVIFVSWVRGLTYFKIHPKTRYLVNLLFQVCSNIIPFLIVFLYSVVGFGISIGLDGTFDEGDGVEEHRKPINLDDITDSYMVSMGSWGSPKNFTTFVFLCLSSIINPVIILSILVAILSDTYVEVQSDQEIADNKELTDMIIEIETLMFWNRNYNDKKYIHLIENDAFQEPDTGDFVSLLRTIRNKIFNLKISLKSNSKSLESLETTTNQKTQELKSALIKLKEK